MQVKLRHASEFTPEKNGKRIYCVNFWVPTPNTHLRIQKQDAPVDMQRSICHCQPQCQPKLLT